LQVRLNGAQTKVLDVVQEHSKWNQCWP
jgi:hypothetical protein